MEQTYRNVPINIFSTKAFQILDTNEKKSELEQPWDK